MRMSISTTSGRCCTAPADRRVAVGGLADHLDVGLGVEQRLEPGPHQGLVVGQQHPDHVGNSRLGARAEPAAGPGPGVERCRPAPRPAPACPAMPLPEPGEPPRRRPAAVVVDLHGDGVVVERRRRPAPARRRRGGWRWSATPARSGTPPARPRRAAAGRPRHRQRRVDAGGDGPGHELVEVRQRRGRRPRRVASPSARSTSSTRRSSPRASPLASLIAASAGRADLGLVLQQVEGDAGLHADQRQVVGEHVVQLLGHAQPLVAGLAPPLLLGRPGPRPPPAPADPARSRWSCASTSSQARSARRGRPASASSCRAPIGSHRNATHPSGQRASTPGAGARRARCVHEGDQQRQEHRAVREVDAGCRRW